MSEAALKYDDKDVCLGTCTGFGFAANGISNKKLFDVTAKDILAVGHKPINISLNAIYPLWSIEHNGEPLRIEVVVDNGHCFTENKFLNVFGDGDTILEAMDDLVDQIHYFREFYSEKSEEQLTGLAIELKQNFAQISIA